MSKLFLVQSAGGEIMVTEKVEGQFFLYVRNNTVSTFYVLQGLESIDGIISDDILKGLGSVFDRKNYVFTIKSNIKLIIFLKKFKNTFIQ